MMLRNSAGRVMEGVRIPDNHIEAYQLQSEGILF